MSSDSTSDYYERLYDELRALAARRVSAGMSLSPTELVNEVYLKLEGHEWASATHFRATSVRAMRQVLVDRARARGRDKRGGGQVPVTLVTNSGESEQPVDLLAVDQGLKALHVERPRAAQVAELRLFGGLTSIEIAGELQVSERTVKSDWRLARAFLQVALES